MQRLFFIALFAAVLWAAGLLLFISELPRPAGDRPAQADGVVVFTGGDDRVLSAMGLLSDGAGKRLLISGVNVSVTREELAALWPGDPAQFDCCVDLGREAETTVGNAAELDHWTRANGFSSLILVTSEFHMPRALVEARDRLPDVAITPYPVESGLIGPDGKPNTPSDWRRIAAEYAKYLAARVKTFVN